jgi:hypothetical protein
MTQFVESADFLQALMTQSQKNGDEARALAADLTEAQLNWKPAPDQWSIAQCLEHLTNASREFNQYFVDAVAQGRRKYAAPAPPVYRPSFMGSWLIKYVEPESPRKLKAPKLLQPSTSNVQDALEKLLEQQKRFRQFVSETDGIDYNRTRLRSPITPLIRYSLADAYVITVVHEQRHLAQARRVRETPGFPIT